MNVMSGDKPLCVIAPESINLLDLPSLALANKDKLPEVAAVYFAFCEGQEILYIGRAVNLKTRWLHHHKFGQLNSFKGVRIAWLEVPNIGNIAGIEEVMIDYFCPPLNGKSLKGISSDYLVVKIDMITKEALFKKAKSERKTASRLISNWVEEYLGEKMSEQELLNLKLRVDRIEHILEIQRLRLENQQLKAWRDSILATAKLAPGIKT